MDCVVCGIPADVLYTGLGDKLHPEVPGSYALKKCSDCGLIYIDPQPTEEELAEHYPAEYGVYRKSPSPPSRLKMWAIKAVAKNYFGYSKRPGVLGRIVSLPLLYKVSHLPRFKANGRLLDVGCGTGTRLVVFRELGWEVEGLEMSKEAAKTASGLGCKVYSGRFEDVNLPSDYYDVVYMNNVFEHFSRPRFCLERIACVLKEGGELVMVVPNSASLGFRMFKENWLGLDVPRHLYTYSSRNLAHLIERYGFRVETILSTNTFTSFASGLALRMGRPAGWLSGFQKIAWILDLCIDPVLGSWGLGDWITVRAIVEKRA